MPPPGPPPGRRWPPLPLIILALLALAGILTARTWVVGYLAWKRALRASGFVDEMAPPGRHDTILIVAPHPDDEVLGCSGLIQQALANGAQVHVVLLTNGDASELAVLFGEKEFPWKPASMIDLGRRRQQESLRALSSLGLQSSHVHFLGFPNNGLVALWRPEHWRYSDLYRSPYTHATFSPYSHTLTPQAPYCGQQLLSDLVALLQQWRPTQIFVTHPRDIHPDHWATDCFLRYALATAAIRDGGWPAATQVWGYLVHWPRFPAPMRVGVNLDLLPPPELNRARAQWYRLSLTREQASRKLAAIRKHTSQEPRFDRLLLRFARQDEIFELLSPDQVERGAAVTWQARSYPRRGLGGAQVDALELRLQRDLQVQAELTTPPRKIPERAYIGLDLRTWDEHHVPVITTLYLGAAGEAEAVRLQAASRPERLPVTATMTGPKTVEISGLSLPRNSAAEHALFVSCWGSINDRITEPAVASWVQFR